MKFLKAFLSLFFLILMVHPIAAQADKATIIIFDASGSMWGQIKQRTKIEIAQEAFKAVQNQWVEHQVGLIAYGHRRKGDCGDIENLVAIETGNIGKVANAIAGLKPKGKTPLAAAVQMAANQLKIEENPANIILFTDGIETCHADPCALVQQLEHLGIDFTAHVIGMGINAQQDQEKLQCIAHATGGLYLEAKDANSLKDSLTKLAKHDGKKTAEAPLNMLVDLELTLKLTTDTVRPDKVRFKALNLKTGKSQNLGIMQGAEQVLRGLHAQLPTGMWRIEAISAEGKGAIEIEVLNKKAAIAVPFSANTVTFSLADNSPYALGIEHSFFLMAEGKLQPNAEYTVALAELGFDGEVGLIDWETRFGSDPEGVSRHIFQSPPKPGNYEVRIIKDGKILNRFKVAYKQQVTPRWQGVVAGAPNASLPISITGDLYYYNRLTLKQNGNMVQSYRIDDLITPDGLRLPLPEKSGRYDVIYHHGLALGEEKETILTRLNVGNVILADDDDAVAPPSLPTIKNQKAEKTNKPLKVAHVENIASRADPATLRKISQDQVKYFCDTEALCNIDIAPIGAKSIPLLKGFGLNGAVKNKLGKPSFEIFNVENGEWLVVNPIHMQQLTTCVQIGFDGTRDPDNGISNDMVCSLKGSNGRTIYQHELLELWLAERNIAQLAEQQKKHILTMGEDEAFNLSRTWSIVDRDNRQAVAILKINQGENDHKGSNHHHLVGGLLMLNGTKIGVKPGEQDDINIAISYEQNAISVGIQFDAKIGSSNISLLLARPNDWDRKSDQWLGQIVNTDNAKIQFVRMY